MWNRWCGPNNIGDCHYCRQTVVFSHYAKRKTASGKRVPTGWEIEHKIARANGGSDRYSNLVVSCWTCNNRKSDRMSARQMLRAFNFRNPPLTFEAAEAARERNRRLGLLVGAMVAIVVGAVFGVTALAASLLAVIGALVGAVSGGKKNPHPL